MNCHRCGAEIKPGAKFCNRCGANQAPASTCRVCGQPVTPGKRFCSHCGSQLSGVACPRCQRQNRANVAYCAHCGTRLAGKPAPFPYGTGRLPPGQMLAGRYLIVRKIAQGGMGAVYEAVSAGVAQATVPHYAIKEMSLSVLQSMKAEQRQETMDAFHREFELLRDLHHPNLVRAYEFLVENHRQYFVMEYLEGCTLETHLAGLPAGQFLSTERVLSWSRQLCELMAYLHKQTPPIIYRDLKPSNLIEVQNTQTIKLFDFGIARFYKPGKKGNTINFGTLGYLAPEIAKGGAQADVQTDLYALGVLILQLLTGYDPLQTPFSLPTARSLNPQVPEAVERAIEHAVQNDRARRVGSAEELLQELAGTPVKAPLPAPAAQPQGITPAPVPAPVPLNLPTAPLFLGRATRGRAASGTLRVPVPPGLGPGQVFTTVPWLEVQPMTIAPPSSILHIRAQTRGLAPGPWQSPGRPHWLDRLPGFVLRWVRFHAGRLVPAPARYEGRILLNFPGAPLTEVPVSVEVCPPDWRVRLGWGLATACLALESGSILGLLILALSSL